MNKCRIYTILICGIPAIGKTYLSKKIVEFYKGNKVGVNCLHMSFDNITNIEEADNSILNRISVDIQPYQLNKKHKIIFRLDRDINVYVYRDFYILSAYSHGVKQFSFFNTKGHKISNNISSP